MGEPLAGNGDTTKRLWGLLIFAGLTLALTIYQRVRRWFELGQRVRQHSYYLGTSLFSHIRWLPESLRYERRLERFADPFAIGVIKVTRDLIRAGQLLKMELLDHVVVGNGNFSSLRALGYFYQ